MAENDAIPMVQEEAGTDIWQFPDEVLLAEEQLRRVFEAATDPQITLRESSYTGIVLPPGLDTLLRSDPGFEPTADKRSPPTPLWNTKTTECIFNHLGRLTDFEQLLTIETLTYEYANSELYTLAGQALLTKLIDAPGNEEVLWARNRIIDGILQHVHLSAYLANNAGFYMEYSNNPAAILQAGQLAKNAQGSGIESLIKLAGKLARVPEFAEELKLTLSDDNQLTMHDGLMPMADFVKQRLNDGPYGTVRLLFGFEMPELDREELANRSVDQLSELYVTRLLHPDYPDEPIDRDLLRYITAKPIPRLLSIVKLFGNKEYDREMQQGFSSFITACRLGGVDVDKAIEDLQHVPKDSLATVLGAIKDSQQALQDIGASILNNVDSKDDIVEHVVGVLGRNTLESEALVRGIYYAFEKRLSQAVALFGAMRPGYKPRKVTVHTQAGDQELELSDPQVVVDVLVILSESLKAVAETLKNPQQIDTGVTSDSLGFKRASGRTSKFSDATITVRTVANENGGSRIGFTIGMNPLSKSLMKSAAPFLRSAGVTEKTLEKLNSNNNVGRGLRKLNFRLDYEEDGSLSFDIGSTYKPDKQPLGLIVAAVMAAAAQESDATRDNHVREFFEQVNVEPQVFARQVMCIARTLQRG